MDGLEKPLKKGSGYLVLLGIPGLIVDQTRTVKTAVDKQEERAVRVRMRGQSWLGGKAARDPLGVPSRGRWELQLVPRREGDSSPCSSSSPLLAFVKL